MSRPERDPRYDDGLDYDGYPIPDGRKPFVHGSEADVGDFKPIRLGDANAAALERIMHLWGLGRHCDSPIECNLGAAVFMFFERAGYPLTLCAADRVLEVAEHSSGLLMVPQFAWSYYRSDWAIVNPARSTALLIECDGRAFHSSKDQKKHDAAKDAAAHLRGWLTMRFTGKQIHKNADGCAQKIYDAVMGGK